MTEDTWTPPSDAVAEEWTPPSDAVADEGDLKKKDPATPAGSPSYVASGSDGQSTLSNDHVHSVEELSPSGQVATTNDNQKPLEVTLAPGVKQYGLSSAVDNERKAYTATVTDANSSRQASVFNPAKTKDDRLVEITKDNFLHDPLFTGPNADANKEAYFSALENHDVDVNHLRREMGMNQVAGNVMDVLGAPVSMGTAAIASGANKLKAIPEYRDKLVAEGATPEEANVKTAFSLMAGGAEIGLGAANATPIGAMFSMGLKTLEVADKEKYAKVIQPVTWAVEKAYGDKSVPEWAHDASLLGDLLVGAVAYHYGGKAMEHKEIDWEKEMPAIVKPLEDHATAKAIAVTHGDPDLVPLVKQQIIIEQDLPSVHNPAVKETLLAEHEKLNAEVATKIEQRNGEAVDEAKKVALKNDLTTDMEGKSEPVQKVYEEKIKELGKVPEVEVEKAGPVETEPVTGSLRDDTNIQNNNETQTETAPQAGVVEPNHTTYKSKLEQVASELDAAYKEFREFRKRTNSLLDPSVLPIIIRIAKAHLKMGIIKLEDFTQKMLDELKKHGIPAGAKAKQELAEIYRRANEEWFGEMGPGEALERMNEIHDETKAAVNKLEAYTWEKFKQDYIRHFEDISGNLKNALSNIDSEEARDAIMYKDMVNKSGAEARMKMNEFNDEIFKGLSPEETETLEKIIAARSDKARSELTDSEGNNRGIQNTAGGTPTFYNKVLADMEDANPDQFKAMNEKADAYFDAFKQLLKLRLDNGLITQQMFDMLNARPDYSPHLFLQHLEADGLKLSGGKPITGATDGGIKKLEGGSDELAVMNPKFLLAHATEGVYKLMAHNDAAKAMFDLASKNPDNGVAYVKDIIGRNKNIGEPIFAETPTGYTTIKAMIDGNPMEMAMKNEFAKEWVANDPAINQGLASAVQWLTGANFLRYAATGYNPMFAMANVPRDVALILLTNKQYSRVLPKALLEVGSDITDVAGDVFSRTGRYKEYIMEGGGMDFLTHQGQFHIVGEGKFSNEIRPYVENANKVLSYIGETSELLTRVALRERYIKNAVRELGHEPTPEELAEIKKRGTYEAANYLDFSQGGDYTKALNAFVPYLNASFQAMRVLARAIKNDPKSVGVVAAQIATLAAGITYWNMSQKGYDMVSDDAKTRNFIIMLGISYKDDKGKTVYPYLKIPKSQEIQPITGMSESLAEFSHNGHAPTKRIWEGLKNGLPPIPFVTQQTPLGEAIRTYQSNYDAFYDRNLWKGYDKNLPAYKEYYTEEWRKTPDKYRKIGEVTKNMGLNNGEGLSPERMRQSIPKMLANTEQNPYVTIPSKAYDVATEAMGINKKDALNKTMMQNVKEMTKGLWSKYYGEAFAHETYSEELSKAAQAKAVATKDRSDAVNEAVGDELKPSEFNTRLEKDFKTAATALQRSQMMKSFLAKSKQRDLDPFYVNLINDDPDLRAERISLKLSHSNPEEKAAAITQINKLIKGHYIPWSSTFESELKNRGITGIASH